MVKENQGLGNVVAGSALVTALGIIGLPTWNEVVSPTFIGEMIIYLAPVIAAYVGGVMTPGRK